MLSDVSPWLVVIVLVFLGFILVVFNAKRDSAVRAAAYTLVLSVLFIYVLTAHLVPEIRCVRSIPGFLSLCGQPSEHDDRECHCLPHSTFVIAALRVFHHGSRHITSSQAPTQHRSVGG